MVSVNQNNSPKGERRNNERLKDSIETRRGQPARKGLITHRKRANATATGATVSSGALSATLSGNDPQFNHTTALNIPGNNVPVVLVRMKSSAGGGGQLFFGNEVGGISAANY